MKYVLKTVRIFFAISLIILAQTSLNPGAGAAWANGGRDPKSVDSGGTTGGGTAARTDSKVSIANNYPQSKYREIRDFQLWIAKNAKKNNLSWIATSEKQMKKFVLTYEKFRKKYKGVKALELHKVFTQLRKYARQKKNPKLAKYAKGMLHSFDVYDKLRYARGKYADWKKAKGVKKYVAKGEYEEAEKEYYESRAKLPFDMIMSFPILPNIR